MTIAERPRIDFSRVPYQIEHTDDGVIVYNDDLRVVVSGESDAEAISNFHVSVAALVDYCITQRVPIPEALLTA